MNCNPSRECKKGTEIASSEGFAAQNVVKQLQRRDLGRMLACCYPDLLKESCRRPMNPYRSKPCRNLPNDIGWLMHELARQRYKDLRTDENGRVSLPCLIPGAQYKLFTFAFGDGRQMWRERKAFKVEAGQQTDLGIFVARRSE